MSQEPGLNRRPTIYDTVALPTELSWLGGQKTLYRNILLYVIQFFQREE